MSTAANSINESSTGICGFTGTSFVATPVSQYQLIVGGSTSSTIGQFGTGTTLQNLISAGAAANPSYKSFSINIQVFNVAGAATYTPTSGMQFCFVECVGAGGGGGGVAANPGANLVAVGSGGGAGAYAASYISAATIGVSKGLVVGTGGVGNSAANGSDGTSTTFDTTLIVAGGGIGGIVGTVDNGTCNRGGDGGTASAGTIQANGNNGGNSFATFNTVAGYACGYSGVGGTSFYGRSGRSTVTNFIDASAVGLSSFQGNGGSGAYATGTAVARAGGNGGSGLVVITEYIWS